MADLRQQQIWSRLGMRKRIEYSPTELLAEAMGYFAWCDDNPLQEMDLRTADGCVIETPVDKMRPYTKRGLLLWLNISNATWERMKRDTMFEEEIEQIEMVIYTQKFEGAAAGLLNANIIARDLGLSDKVEQDHKSSDGTMSPATIDWSKLDTATLIKLRQSGILASDDAGN